MPEFETLTKLEELEENLEAPFPFPICWKRFGDSINGCPATELSTCFGLGLFAETVSRLLRTLKPLLKATKRKRRQNSKSFRIIHSQNQDLSENIVVVLHGCYSTKSFFFENENIPQNYYPNMTHKINVSKQFKDRRRT